MSILQKFQDVFISLLKSTTFQDFKDLCEPRSELLR